MPRWEYLVVVVNAAGEYMIDEVDKQGRWRYKPINELGAEGWELVALAFLPGDQHPIGWFKRSSDTARTGA